MPVPPGELLTKLSVWLALLGYAIGAALLLLTPRHSCYRSWARWAWTFGCAFFVGHVVCAFNYYHHWSHSAAYRETARQTAELTGWQSGGGIYLNYVFAAGWFLEVLWWWLAPASFDRRPTWLTVSWHSFLIFMIFNGTVVFGHGPVRIFGAIICVTLAVLSWRRSRLVISP